MEELWGIKTLLDCSADVGVLIVAERDLKVLYCNHYVTVKTGLRAETMLSDMWKQAEEIREEMGESRTHRKVVWDSPFGGPKNITLTKIVWVGGIQAIAMMITNHLENKDELERELIFKALGQSYISMYVIDTSDWTVSMLKGEREEESYLFRPLPLEEWKQNLLRDSVFEEDAPEMETWLNRNRLPELLEENNERISFQFRRKVGEEYHWCEYQARRLGELNMGNKIIITEKDIHGKKAINSKHFENEMIMKSLANIYRSVYLLDLNIGEYETVKPDTFLFGIPAEGKFEELLNIVEELIPDQFQQKDLREYFSLQALKDAFASGLENIGREYNSTLSKETSWMSIAAFPTPCRQGMENKCVVTFMDITEHKRVEAERNEKNMVVEVLSSRYVAVFLTNLRTGTYHSIKMPQKYTYVEKQFKNFAEAIEHYAKAYVLEQYRDIFRKVMEIQNYKVENGGSFGKREYIYRSVDDIYYRLNVFLLSNSKEEEPEIVLAFERYDDVVSNNLESK